MMNKISLIEKIKDDELILHLARDSTRPEYPTMINLAHGVINAYSRYASSKGNGLIIKPIGLGVDKKEYLIYHYNHPSKYFSFINNLRLGEHIFCCPLCGSIHTYSLDHILPKDIFPEYAVYSHNLVPVCNCNSKKWKHYIGNVSKSERILHPYFDDCLKERLVVAKFESLGPEPIISFEIKLCKQHSDFNAVNYHVKKVINKKKLIAHLNSMWSKLMRQPHIALRQLPDELTSYDQFIELLKTELQYHDDFYESKNNWFSIFYSGLCSDNVSSWLFNMLNQPNRKKSDPLIDEL